MDPGFALNEAHVNVSCDKYPVKKGKWTVAPGQYIFNAGELDMTAGLVVTFADVTGPVWIIIHGVTCDVPGSGSPDFGIVNLGIYCNPGILPKESIVIKPQPNVVNEIDMNIHPNPFISSTDIDFTLPWSEEVTVEIYNTLGEKVSTLYHATADANQKYFVRFNVPNKSGQGMYLCVIRTKLGYAVKPLIVTR